MTPAAIVWVSCASMAEREGQRVVAVPGAEISGRPLWLASALEKLEMGAQRIDNPTAERNPASAHVFIINPLHGGAVDGLFTTHPKTANRIAALRAMAGATARGPWG